jgi:23S rRNA (cytosine1962-C5)-methyltransferase
MAAPRPRCYREPMQPAPDHPLIRLNPGQERRLKSGHPWAFSNEIRMQPDYRAMPPGAPVRLDGDDGWRFGTFMFNPHSLIAARLLDRDPAANIDAAFVAARIAAAADLRAKVCDTRYHRLVHAEADRLPGLVIDRYDDVLVLQANTAGMDRLTAEIVAALQSTLAPRAIVARNDAPVRGHEGLPEQVGLLAGTDATANVEEGSVTFPVDPLSGQKTGWFFDQRPNRDRIAALASGARMLDVFCHVGAFGLRAAAAGAIDVTLVDSSAPALALAEQAAGRNGLRDRVHTRRGDAFDVMTELAQQDERFDIVVCDPPAFAKARKDQAAGLRAYQRMARLAAPLVRPGGFLLAASCSHHATPELFAQAIADGLHRARREARIVFSGGAGPDHPVHPHLPESAYLKAELIQIVS